MVATLLVLGLASVAVFGELYRAHMPVFVCLWFFIPVVAYWLNTRPVLSTFSVSSFKVARAFLFGIVMAVSFASFANFDRIRDSIGNFFVDGYEVIYYEVADEYGRPTTASDVSTVHWYSKFVLWIFEWSFLGVCVAIPYVTWYGASRAVDEAIRQSAEIDAVG